MTKEQFLINIKNEFKNIDISDIEIKIEKYQQILNEYNNKFNLTRLNDDAIIFQEYFYDSIIPYKEIDFSTVNNLLDIGSGSGIPGFLIKIFYPSLNLYIVESNNKKCEFLKILANKLSFDNVFIINERAETYAHKNINKFDLITCRAVAELKILIELATPMCKLNGLMVFPKSLNYLNELENAKWIIDEFNLPKYTLSHINSNNKDFYTLFFVKEKDVDKKYPRQWKEIIK